MESIEISAEVGKLPRGRDVYVLVPGTKLYDDVSSGDTVDIVGTNGDSVEVVARIVVASKLADALVAYGRDHYASLLAAPFDANTQRPIAVGIAPAVQAIRAIYGEGENVDPKLTDVMRSYTVVSFQLPLIQTPIPTPGTALT